MLLIHLPERTEHLCLPSLAWMEEVKSFKHLTFIHLSSFSSPAHKVRLCVRLVLGGRVWRRATETNLMRFTCFSPHLDYRHVLFNLRKWRHENTETKYQRSRWFTTEHTSCCLNEAAAGCLVLLWPWLCLCAEQGHLVFPLFSSACPNQCSAYQRLAQVLHINKGYRETNERTYSVTKLNKSQTSTIKIQPGAAYKYIKTK